MSILSSSAPTSCDERPGRLDFDADVEAFRAEFADFLTTNLPTT